MGSLVSSVVGVPATITHRTLPPRRGCIAGWVLGDRLGRRGGPGLGAGLARALLPVREVLGQAGASPAGGDAGRRRCEPADCRRMAAQSRGGRSAVNLMGRAFGRLTVLARAASLRRRPLWRCRCACGGERVVLAASLRDGKTQSCGCLHVER